MLLQIMVIRISVLIVAAGTDQLTLIPGQRSSVAKGSGKFSSSLV